MPILNIDVNAIGQSGLAPKFIFIETNDTVAEVTTTGYLNGMVSQNIPWLKLIWLWYLLRLHLTPNPLKWLCLMWLSLAIIGLWLQALAPWL